MSDQRVLNREHQYGTVEDRTAEVMQTWYISYADEEGFRGAVVVDATNELGAAARSREVGASPGGQAYIVLVPEGSPALPKDRLLSMEELSAFDEMVNPSDEMFEHGGELLDEGEA